MRKLSDMRKHRQELLENAERLRNQLDNKDRRQLARQLEYVDTVIKYLETEPREGFVEKELQRVQDRLISVYDGFDTWKSKNPDMVARVLRTKTKLENYYHNQMGVPELRKQEDMLKYILEK